MQGLWNLIGKAGQGPGKDFQYDIGEKLISTFDSKSIWTLHHGKKKASGELVSVFVCDGKTRSSDEVYLAKTAHKRLKTLRHPNIIKYLDGFESENLVYAVTEAVTPLCTVLHEEDGKNSHLISWGLHQVTNGLSFLINNCNLSHENVNIFSVFVGVDGEWKLGGVEYVHPVDLDSVAKLPNLTRYDPPEGRERKNGHIWSADSWGLGCLIWEIYNYELQKPSDLKATSKIPKPLIVHYCDLVSANPKNRTNPQVFLEKTTKKGQFLDNSFIQANLFLQEIQIKDQNAQKEFFQSLDKNLDDFPTQFCVHKILPQLLNAFDYGPAGSSVLSPLFKVGLLLDDVAYQAKILPCIIKLFSSNDRATRIQLLQQMEKFVKHLHPAVVDSQIFGCVATGFGDTLPAMREQTIKAMLLLAPKLSEKTISNHLLRYFAKLQMDEEPGIRTNTTICLGKIAQYIPQATRQKVLIPAFSRALRDPFPPARSGGIMAIAATKEYYSMPDIACKVLPGLCACTVDPEKSVRDNAFKVIKMFMTNLEKYSSDPESALNNKETAEREAKAQDGSTWAGWAVSSFTSRFYTSTSQSNKQEPQQDTASNSVETPKQENPKDEQVEKKRSEELCETPGNDTLDESDHSDYGDAWEEEWKDIPQEDFAAVRKDVMAVRNEVSQFSQKRETSGVENMPKHDSDNDYGDWGAGDDWDEGGDAQNGSHNKSKQKKPAYILKKTSQSKSKNEEKSVAELLGMDSSGVDFLTGEKFLQNSKVNKNSTTPISTITSTSNTDGWDDDGGWDNDTSWDVTRNPVETKTKSSLKNNGWEGTKGDWDDSFTDKWDVDNTSCKAEEEFHKNKRKEELAKKREDRKLQRELANKEKKTKTGGGALKLGAVKKHAN